MLFKAAERYLRRCRWWDLALVKVCLCATGVLVGLAVPGRKKRATAWVAATVFATSYAAVMARFLPVLAEPESDGEEQER